MKKYFTLILVSTFSLIGYSQNQIKQNSEKMNAVVRSNKELLEVANKEGEVITSQVNNAKKIIVISAEKLSEKASLDPINSGFIKVTIDGKEVYQKEIGQTTIIYNPNN